jgi:hypothetical protein
MATVDSVGGAVGLVEVVNKLQDAMNKAGLPTVLDLPQIAVRNRAGEHPEPSASASGVPARS